MAATALTAEQARLLVPGMSPEALLAGEEYAALLIQGGLVIDSHRYLRHVHIPFRILLMLDVQHKSFPGASSSSCNAS